MNPPHRHIERVFNKYGSFPQKDDIILNDQRYGSTSGSKSGHICHFPHSGHWWKHGWLTMSG